MPEVTTPNTNPNPGDVTVKPEGDAAATAAATAATASGAVKPGEGGQPNSEKGGDAKGTWQDGLPEQFRELAKGFDSPDAAVKELTGLKGKIPVVPDKPESFKVEFDKTIAEIPQDAIDGATKIYENWRPMAHTLGLTQAQFKTLVSMDARIRMEQSKKSMEEFKKDETTLKDEWKSDFDANLGKAEDVVSKIFDDDFRGFLKKSGLADNPKFVKAMFNLSQSLSEDTFVRSQNRGADTGRKIDPSTGKPMLKYPSMDKK